VQFRLDALVKLPKIYWTRVLGSVVICLNAGECTLNVDRALGLGLGLANSKNRILSQRQQILIIINIKLTDFASFSVSNSYQTLLYNDVSPCFKH